MVIVIVSFSACIHVCVCVSERTLQFLRSPAKSGGSWGIDGRVKWSCTHRQRGRKTREQRKTAKDQSHSLFVVKQENRLDYRAFYFFTFRVFFFCFSFFSFFSLILSKKWTRATLCFHVFLHSSLRVFPSSLFVSSFILSFPPPFSFFRFFSFFFFRLELRPCVFCVYVFLSVAAAASLSRTKRGRRMGNVKLGSLRKRRCRKTDWSKILFQNLSVQGIKYSC